MNIVVLGLWHLGCVTAACCAEHFSVTGIDFDNAATTPLAKEGRAPLFEPGLDDLLQKNIAKGSLTIATDSTIAEAALRSADVLWVCYDTPVDDHDVADQHYVLERLERCLPFLKEGTVVLISSQLSAGTGKRLEQKHISSKLVFASSPENLRLGNALNIFRNPDRVVVGVKKEATHAHKILEALFAPFANDRILWMSPESAEMTKHAINAFLALSITFANELACICESVGADAREVEEGLRQESRIGRKAYLHPGSAFAGGTLARDVVSLTSLAQTHGRSVELIPAILKSNEAHKQWALVTLKSIFPSLSGVKIAVLGLTYKPGTSTLRRSSALELCRALIEAGCEVQCFDPAIQAPVSALPKIKICSDIETALKDVDAAVVATQWPEIKAANWVHLTQEIMHKPIVLDANHFLALSEKQFAHLSYFTVGTKMGQL